MKILLTGNRGRIGPPIERQLLQDGHEVRGFDLATDDNILDAAAVATAAAGTDAIVHVAGIAGDRGRPPAEVLGVNLAGTANVLIAAETQGVTRVIYMSSGRALGLLERDPDYLPLDDDHRGLPSAPYALSKWLAEEMCEAFSVRTGVQTLCLRPVQIFDDADYRQALSKPAASAASRFWPLGVHIHVLDVASAVAAAVRCDAPQHARLLLCAADIASERPTLDLVAEHIPRVPWRGREMYQTDRYRSLVDTRKAQSLLGWWPVNLWPGRKSSDEASKSLVHRVDAVAQK
jgi:UDP-glucose 4-epimerase